MYMYIYMHVYIREKGDRAIFCETGFCDARDLVGGCECMKDAAILVTSLLQFQLEGFAPQIKKASRLRKTMDGQTTSFSGVDRNSGMGGRLSVSNKYKLFK